MSSATVASEALRRFVDDELLRAPLLVETVADAVFTDLRGAGSLLPQRERARARELLQDAQACRPRMVQRFVQSLRDQVESEIGSRRPGAAPLPPVTAGLPRLGLVDDDTVAADIEISHVTRSVKDHAEHEVRELAAYVATLRGDWPVTRDHNPFRPEVVVRALWEATQALPPSGGFRLAFLRSAGAPLAQVLRKSYAAACGRLDAAGIEPAMHRTLVRHGGTRTFGPADSWLGTTPELQRVSPTAPPAHPAPAAQAARPATADAVPGRRDPFPATLAAAGEALRTLPPQAPAPTVAVTVETWRDQLVSTAPTAAGRQTVELLGGLFAALAGDRHLAAGVPALLAALFAPALQLALRDGRALEDQSHPLWRFVERAAFVADMLAVAPAGLRDELHRLLQAQVERIADRAAQDPEAPSAALDALARWEGERLERMRRAIAVDPEALDALEQALQASTPPPPTAPAPLDEAQLETVPAVLLDALPLAGAADTAAAARWLRQCAPGDWLRIFVRGRWRRAQWLAHSTHGEVVLLVDAAAAEPYALRRGALERLRAEGLLARLEPLPIVGRAAGRVQRRPAAAGAEA